MFYLNLLTTYFITLIIYFVLIVPAGLILRLFKKKVTNKTPIISFYYPSSFELNILSILDIEYFKKSKFLLPIIEENDVMNFYKWNKKYAKKCFT